MLETELTRRDRSTKVVLLVIILVSGVTVAVWMYGSDRYSLLYYGDSVHHLIAGRKFFDWSENPGWRQIGTVWLPLPHVLLMFPSMVDALFFSGFAGLVISLPCLALGAVLLYEIIVKILLLAPELDRQMIRYAAFAGGLLYGINPNFLFLGINAMTETLFMLFFIASAYFFVRWYETQKTNNQAGNRYLLASAAMISAATLCRYEGWILPIAFIIASIVSAAVISSKKRRIDHETHSNYSVQSQQVVGYHYFALVLAASIVSLSGIAFWLAFNYLTQDGDPFRFANAQYYSAASQALFRPFREVLVYQPSNVLNVYGATAFMVYGPVLLATAAIGFYRQMRSKQHDRWLTRYTYAFFAIPPIFTIISLIIGIGEMGFWFNSRFLILLAPLVIVLTAWFISRLPKWITRRRLVLAGVLVSLFAFQLSTPFFSAVVTLDDAKGGYFYKESPDGVVVGEKVRQFYDGKGLIMIMTGSGQEHKIMIASGLHLNRFDEIIESSNWKKSYYQPWNYNDTLIVISKVPDPDDVKVAKYWSEHRAELDSRYNTVFEDQYYEILSMKKF